MKHWLAGLAALTLLAACGLPVGVPASVTPLSQAELKYRLIDRFGPPVYCDPDEYPVARGDPVTLARQHLPEIQRDQATYQAVLRRHGFSGDSLSDQQAVAVYQDWKNLRAVKLTPHDSGYSFQGLFTDRSYTGNALPVLAVSGTIDRTGAIEVTSSVRAAPPPCPICLAESTLIDTPAGSLTVSRITVGLLIWTSDGHGGRVAAPVLKTGSVPAPPGHLVSRLELADGRRVLASPGHPTADGGRLGQLRPGDRLDGSVVLSVETVLYGGARTYDLLPAGPTGTYWADGVLLGSTLGGQSRREPLSRAAGLLALSVGSGLGPAAADGHVAPGARAVL